MTKNSEGQLLICQIRTQTVIYRYQLLTAGADITSVGLQTAADGIGGSCPERLTLIQTGVFSFTSWRIYIRWKTIDVKIWDEDEFRWISSQWCEVITHRWGCSKRWALHILNVCYLSFKIFCRHVGISENVLTVASLTCNIYIFRCSFNSEMQS